MCAYIFFALTTLFAAATSAPTPSPSTPGLATVDLRLRGPQSNHYATQNQAPTTDNTQHLTIIVGQTLALERDPLPVQGLEIVGVTAGESLSILPQGVEVDDWRVTCVARFEGREDVVEFDMKDRGVLLAGGRVARVVRLSCAISGEEKR
ncbi:hypothetical protein OPT61_g9472 [Boeremia exigua]|uniref:Uncharacterized protein n=1 Tax=Boeremia exigua TaxID=749465 RepID=A0ACC2HUT0_9PLEO|nr:hypothetical protein OPT61_g9472 [Boeremia exigua]